MDSPLGERIAAVEARLEGLQTGQDTLLEQMRTLMSDRDERRAMERLGRQLMELVKVLLPAALAAAITAWLARHG